MKKCPKCGSKDYSAKWALCPKCGRNDTPVTPKEGAEVHIPKVVTPVIPVTPDTEPFVPDVTDDTSEVVEHYTPVTGVMPKPGAVCVLCGEKKPSKAALKQREWRRKNAADVDAEAI